MKFCHATTFLLEHSYDMCIAGSTSDDIWSCWSSWTYCSITCGNSGGTRTRSRVCVPGTSGSSSSLSCSGEPKESEACGSSDACPSAHCPYGFQYNSG